MALESKKMTPPTDHVIDRERVVNSSTLCSRFSRLVPHFRTVDSKAR